MTTSWAGIIQDLESNNQSIAGLDVGPNSEVYLAQNNLGFDPYMVRWDSTTHSETMRRRYGDPGGFEAVSDVMLLSPKKAFLFGEFHSPFSSDDNQAKVDFGGFPLVSRILTGSVRSMDLFIAALTVADDPTKSITSYAKRFGDYGDDLVNFATSDKQNALFMAGQLLHYAPNSAVQLSDQVPALAYVDDSDIFVAKLDGDANMLWARSAGSAGTEIPTGIVWDPKGRVYVCGDFQQTVDFGNQKSLAVRGALTDGYVVSYSATDGKTQWAAYPGSTLWTPKAITFASNLVLIAGYDANHMPQLSAINPDDGTLKWSVSMNGWIDNIALSSDAAGNAYVAMGYKNSVVWGNTTFGPAAEALDMVIVKFDPKTQEIIWTRSFGSAGDQQPTHIAIDEHNIVTVTGTTRGQIDFGAGLLGDANQSITRNFIVQLQQ